jgi:hypothetical protein
MVRAATDDITDFQVYCCGVRLHADDAEVAAAASREGEVLTQFPSPIDVAVAVVDIHAVTLDKACGIVRWLESLRWPQHRALIMTSPSHRRNTFAADDVRRRCERTRVLIACAHRSRSPAAVRSVIDCALEEWPTRAPRASTATPYRLRIAMVLGPYWLGFTAAWLNRVAATEQLTTFVRHAHIQLGASHQAIVGALTVKLDGEVYTCPCVDVVCAAAGPAAERDATLIPTCEWLAQLRPYMFTVMLVDVSESGPRPTDGVVLRGAMASCAEHHVYFDTIQGKGELTARLKVAIDTLVGSLEQWPPDDVASDQASSDS